MNRKTIKRPQEKSEKSYFSIPTNAFGETQGEQAQRSSTAATLGEEINSVKKKLCLSPEKTRLEVKEILGKIAPKISQSSVCYLPLGKPYPGARTPSPIYNNDDQ